MEKIKRSLFGYSPAGIESLVAQKDDTIFRQQQDIDFLRQENEHLKAKIENLENKIARRNWQNIDSQNEILVAPNLPKFANTNKQKNGENSIQKTNDDTPIFGM
jgi:hypothetical protein